MAETDVYMTRERGTLSIVLNRPDKLNALTEHMAGEITALLEQARVDDAVRCVVLRGEGRAFCAGDDLGRKIPAELGPPDIETKMKTSYVRVLQELINLRKPVVAVLQGYALGAGLDLALACDFRVAADDLQVGSPVVQWGLGGAGVYLLTHYLGFGKATELCLLGERLSAAEAHRLGLVTTVVPVSELDDAVAGLANRLENAATGSIGAIKTARNGALAADPARGLRAQVVANLELMLLADPSEGRAAWREGRQPHFTGGYNASITG